MCICIRFWNYNLFGYLKGAKWSEYTVLSPSCTIMLAKSTVLCWNMLLCCMAYLADKIIPISNHELQDCSR